MFLAETLFIKAEPDIVGPNSFACIRVLEFAAFNIPERKFFSSFRQLFKES
jgi:hypothetical protein